MHTQLRQRGKMTNKAGRPWRHDRVRRAFKIRLVQSMAIDSLAETHKIDKSEIVRRCLDRALKIVSKKLEGE